MSEFSIIDEYCRGLGYSHPETQLSVGDDAAVVDVPVGMDLVVSVDTMVEGVHFFADLAPARLAHKLLAVNLSDMAAMGATPKWATLALTIPQVDSGWLRAFSDSLHSLAREYRVQLIGGDTTSGPLTLSLQIMGLVKKGDAIVRSGAREGDAVYVSGYLGDAALALQQRQEQGSVNNPLLLQALELPQPQVELGVSLLGSATAAIDVSDGLVADLAHIAKASDVSIELEVSALPLSESFLAAQAPIALALHGGDDYQLAFTAPEAVVARLEFDAKFLITQIGHVVSHGDEPVVLRSNGEQVPIRHKQGFDHFEK